MINPLKHVEYLALEIGARPAGTEEEQKASMYIADTFKKRADLDVEVSSFSGVIDKTLVTRIFLAIISVFAILALALPGFIVQFISIILILSVLFGLEVFDKPLVSKIFAKGISQNVVAKYKPTLTSADQIPRKQKVILVAGYDSKKAMLEYKNSFSGIYGMLQKVSSLAPIYLIIVLMIKALMGNFDNSSQSVVFNILAGIGIIACLYPIVFSVITKFMPYTEAANCNASGISVVLSVAEKIGRGEVTQEEWDSFNQQNEDHVLLSGIDSISDEKDKSEVLSSVEEIRYNVDLNSAQGTDTPADAVQNQENDQNIEKEGMQDANIQNSTTDDTLSNSSVGDIANYAAQPNQDYVHSENSQAAQTLGAETGSILVDTSEVFNDTQNSSTDSEVESKHDSAELQVGVDVAYPSEGAAPFSSDVPDWFAAGISMAKRPSITSVNVERSQFADLSKRMQETVSRDSAGDKQVELPESNKDIASHSSSPIPGFLVSHTTETEISPEPVEIAAENPVSAEVPPATIAGLKDDNEKSLDAPSITEGLAEKGCQDVHEPAVSKEDSVPLPSLYQTDPHSLLPQNYKSATSGISVQSKEVANAVYTPSTPAEPLKEDTNFGNRDKFEATLPSLDALNVPSPRTRDYAITDLPSLDSLNIAKPSTNSHSEELSSLPALDLAPVHVYEDSTRESAELPGLQNFSPNDPGSSLKDDSKNEKIQIEESVAESKEYAFTDNASEGESYPEDNTYSARTSLNMPNKKKKGFISKLFGDKNAEDEAAGSFNAEGNQDDRNSGWKGGSSSKSHTVLIPQASTDTTFEDLVEETSQNAGVTKTGLPILGEAEVDNQKTVSFSPINSGDANSVHHENIIEFLEGEQRKMNHLGYPGIDTEIWFVGLGAEMSNNAGMRAFLQEYSRDLRGAMIVNLESLGCGELNFIETEGSLFQSKISARIKRYIRKAERTSGENISQGAITCRDTSSYVARKYGYQALTIAALENRTQKNYAQTKDTFEKIDENILNKSARYVVELIKAI